MATHKADGLFYVTLRMLREHGACWEARNIVELKAIDMGFGIFDVDAQIPVTFDLIIKLYKHVTGVASWMHTHVPYFNIYFHKITVAQWKLPVEYRTMDALYELAVHRKLVKP